MTSFFQKGLAAQIALVVAMSVAAYTGMIPTSLPEVPHADWLGHAVGIGGLAFFLDGVLRQRPLWGGRGSLAAAIVLFVAGVEEYAQRFSPRRSSSWGDFAADVVGVFFFVWLSRRLTAARGTRAIASA
jgi:VanZ family protein